MVTREPIKVLNNHAYLLIDYDSVHTDLLLLLESTHKITPIGNPDFFDRFYETFTIDDSREVKTFHNTRPVSSTGKKIFILRMSIITVEAQNALLKLLEEPAEYAHFFVIIPSAHLLLPTVKSRMTCLVIDNGGFATDSIHTDLLRTAHKLITLSKAKRLEEVKKLIDEITKEKKSKQNAIDLLDAIQAVIYREKGIKNGRSALKAIETARTYIYDRAPSVKMLLEYVMLSI